MDAFRLQPEELDSLAVLWNHHRRGVLFPCTDKRDSKLEYADGGGIGTRVLFTCGCGEEFDITDYSSW